MKRPPLPLRWWAYAAAALALTAALWLGPPTPETEVVQVVPRRPPARVAPSAVSSAPPDTNAIVLLTRAAGPLWGDPFAPGPGLAAGAPSALAGAAPRAAPAASAPVDFVAAEPPPLPFSFLGRWTEQGRTTVFLQRGDKTLPILGPGRIDDRYRVSRVDDQGLLIEHLPSRTTQALRFDAPAPAAAPAGAAGLGAGAAARAAAPATETSAAEPMGEN